MFSKIFKAILKEAQFTKMILGAGATQIRKANFLDKGIYFQSFTNLSTGIERIGKLCIIIDYANCTGNFQDKKYLKSEIGHKILLIYEKSKDIISKNSISMQFLQQLNHPIHQAILKILSDFAEGDRYSNLDLVIGERSQNDSIESWVKYVDQRIFENHISQKSMDRIKNSAEKISEKLSPKVCVMYISELGNVIETFYDMNYLISVQEAIAPFRQLYVVQIIRYWVEILSSLENISRENGNNDIPFFDKIFAPFLNCDSYIKTKKRWDNI